MLVNANRKGRKDLRLSEEHRFAVLISPEHVYSTIGRISFQIYLILRSDWMSLVT